jgi:hypothetical protein
MCALPNFIAFLIIPVATALQKNHAPSQVRKSWTAHKDSVRRGRGCQVVTSLDCGDSEELPVQKTGGVYKTNSTDALRFCSGLYVPCTSGRGDVPLPIDSLRAAKFSCPRARGHLQWQLPVYVLLPPKSPSWTPCGVFVSGSSCGSRHARAGACGLPRI